MATGSPKFDLVLSSEGNDSYKQVHLNFDLVLSSEGNDPYKLSLVTCSLLQADLELGSFPTPD